MASNSLTLPTSQAISSNFDIFNRLTSSILNIDPVTFCESNLYLDGKPFRLSSNGYKPFIDIYRYIGVQAPIRGGKSKPVVLVKGRQVGATTMATNLEMYFMACGLFGMHNVPPMRVMHAFPQLDLAKKYAKTKLNSTIENSKPTKNKYGKIGSIMKDLMSDNNSQDSMFWKFFQNGNYLTVDSLGTDGDRVRGQTVDAIFFDEVQDMFRSAINNTKQLLKQSQHGKTASGIQVYMGTPKTKDSVYYEMWQNSNQQYYFLSCEHCGQYFPLYTPGSDEWKEIWLDNKNFVEYCTCGCGSAQNLKEYYDKGKRIVNVGFQVKCTHCNHVQDKRLAAERGKWIGKENEDKYEYIGFHINQLYMPEFDKQTIISQSPEFNTTIDQTAWMNEILGEFYSGDGSTITADEIKAKCGDYERKMRKVILPEECYNERNVYLGCDWGKKVDGQEGGQSYSCAVILKVEGPQLFSVQFATKFARNDLKYKMEVIDYMMNSYNVKLATGDIGYANDLMVELSNKYGNKFLATHAEDRQIQGKVRYNEKDYPPTISFERNFYIEELFGLLKKGAIRFPFKIWDDIAWLIIHCSSMIVKKEMDKFGNVKTKYCKGNVPNDGLMALINAYLAYKFDVTGGFKNIKNAYSSDEYAPSKICAVGAYIPRMKLTM